MFRNYPGITLEPALGTKEDKIEHLSSYAHVVLTSAKQVISRRRKNGNVYKMSKNEKCTCKACKNTVFHCKICKFVGFLLLSSLWLLKLPNREFKIYDATVAKTSLKIASSSFSVYRWFSRYVIAAMLVDENKRFLINSFCSSTSNCTLQHCYLCP